MENTAANQLSPSLARDKKEPIRAELYFLREWNGNEKDQNNGFNSLLDIFREPLKP